MTPPAVAPPRNGSPAVVPSSPTIPQSIGERENAASVRHAGLIMAMKNRHKNEILELLQRCDGELQAARAADLAPKPKQGGKRR